jgi:amphi-Trp domain-containing protein
MRQEKNIFSHLSMQNAKSIEPILAAIGKGLTKGELKFSDEDDEIILNPEGLLKLKVSATKSDSIHKLNLKVSWYVADTDLDKKKPLSVSSQKSKKK